MPMALMTYPATADPQSSDHFPISVPTPAPSRSSQCPLSPFLGPLQSRVRLSLFSPICHQCPGRLRVAPRGQRALLMNGGGDLFHPTPENGVRGWVRDEERIIFQERSFAFVVLPRFK